MSATALNDTVGDLVSDKVKYVIHAGQFQRVGTGEARLENAESAQKGAEEVRRVYPLELDVSGLDSGERGSILF